MRSELDAKNSTWRVLGAQEARLKHSAELLGGRLVGGGSCSAP